MKVDSVKNNRRALFALLLCSGFIASHPLTVFASSNEVQATQQQNLTVSGVVKDNAGEPVIGASIAVKGGTTGTISDIDGKFSLNVAKGAILEVSFIGYKTQEFKIDSSKSLNIVLKDDTEMLDEVVVVGLCTDICVMANATLIRTAMPNTPVRVDASCCAGSTPEAHRCALEAMKSLQIDIDE